MCFFELFRMSLQKRLMLAMVGLILLMLSSMKEAYSDQFAFRKFQRGLGRAWTLGIAMPVVMITGRCWLWGKSPSTSLVTGIGVWLSFLVTNTRSGVYSCCQRADLKVPLSFGLKTRQRSAWFAHSLTWSPAASFLL